MNKWLVKIRMESDVACVGTLETVIDADSDVEALQKYLRRKRNAELFLKEGHFYKFEVTQYEAATDIP